MHSSDRAESGVKGKKGERSARCREKLQFDPDLVAVLNISWRGRVRFARSESVGVEGTAQELDADPT